MRQVVRLLLLIGFLGGSDVALADCHLRRAPQWLKETQSERVFEGVAQLLEVNFKPCTAEFVFSQPDFEARHRLGPSVAAVTFADEQRIVLGPVINRNNFDFYYGHELVHLALAQKYGRSVPAWLEEGLANFMGRRVARSPQKTNAKELLVQIPKAFGDWKKFDLRKLSHPFLGKAAQSSGMPAAEIARIHYAVSTAAAEFLKSKCDLAELLQMSVKRNLETYLPELCRIRDLNVEFKLWLERKAA